jgi:hypothetical protein
MFDSERYRLLLARRTFLGRSALGLGSLALASLWEPRLLAPLRADTGADGRPKVPHYRGIIHPRHFSAKVKRIIWLYMSGGPSHLETLDPKPKLAEMNGKPMPESITKGQPIAQLQGAKLVCMAPQHPFKKCGKSGQEISTIFPHLSKVADELCIVRSLRTEAINHDPAHTFMNTGTTISGRPSMGSWLWYGLGSACDNLPGFVVLTSLGRYGQAQPIAARQWHSGFLPSSFQGVEFRSTGDPVLYVNSPGGVTAGRQRDIVDTTEALNRLYNETADDPEVVTRIRQYEMAFRMQTSVPELMDLSGETKATLDLYGTKGGDGSFASNCLLARRLAERGVRFIQLYHRDWDHHGGIKDGIAGSAREVDQGAAALLIDLKRRGLLDDTLVVWGGEFGRTPMAQGSGRDHHIKGFSMWLAGGGIKPGITYGATDEFGYNAVENVVDVHDLHATVLHMFGVDHERLTYLFQGRQFRLTDVTGKVVKDILA